MYYSQVLEEVHGTLRGPQEGVKQGVDRERQNLDKCLYRGFWLRLNWSNQTKRAGVPRVLSKGYTGNIL